VDRVTLVHHYREELRVRAVGGAQAAGGGRGLGLGGQEGLQVKRLIEPHVRRDLMASGEWGWGGGQQRTRNSRAGLHYLGGAEEGRLREDEPLEREHYDRSHAVQRGGPHRSHFAVATVALVGVGAVKQLQS
jgi:hypothetical protein